MDIPTGHAGGQIRSRADRDRTLTIIGELLADHQPFHSPYQINRFILGNAVTNWGAYKQALREIRTRVDALKIDYVKRERERIKIARLHEDPRRESGSTLDRSEWRCDLAEREFALESIDAMTVDRERELEHFVGSAMALRAKLGDLTPDRRAALDDDHWRREITLQVASELQVRQLAPNTMRSLMLLPRIDRDRILNLIRHNPGELLAELDNFAIPHADPVDVSIGSAIEDEVLECLPSRQP